MIVVIDYKAGNLYNVGNALKYLKADFTVSGDPDVVSQAERVILPGVGSARAAMDSLAEQGLVEVLQGLRVPFLGICLGLQLLFEVSEEDNTPCLGLLPGAVRRFDSSQIKVPHIGWNQVSGMDVSSQPPSILLEGIPGESFFYFVHSYFAPLESPFTLGKTDYGSWFGSVAARENFYGVQFHPERSGEIGLKVLQNFLEVQSS
ncbi:MAG: imidazole glycerol phosphate synthase subunit HisH [Acidobacteriota bacterium]|jgi:glutamine amidotransferase